jgi:tetrahydromethanopterin S-methyltransferase subunit G
MVASVAVMARETWSDERLDDLKENVNQRFDGVDERFDRHEAAVNARFDEVDKRFDKVDKRFDKIEAETKAGFGELHARFDSMQQTIIICFTGMTATIVASVIGAVLLR